jgi:hypothetical protein
MSKKREIFRMIDRDMVNPTAAEAVKNYIDDLIKRGAKNGPEAAGNTK